MDLEGIKKLLSEVGRIRAKVESYNQASGRCFNIFSIANIATDEVKICRVLHAVLDPTGPHYQGAEFLKLFVEKVLRPGRVFTEDEYKSAEVSREYSTDEGRRIDLFLQIGGENIPIEAKIYAGDQNEQCKCYAKYASEGMPVYYLTPDGHEPENFSRGKLPAEKLELRSFADDILPWLDECLRLPSVIRVAPVREILLQFQDAIREFTGTMEDDMTSSIQKLISNPDGMRKAIDICQALEELHKQIKTKFFESLNNKIEEKYSVARFIQVNDYTKKDTYPGISYEIGKIDGNALCLRVEISHSSGKIYCGLCVLQDKGFVTQSDYKKLQAEIIHGEWSSTSYWPAYRYFKHDKEIPDFVRYNEAYCSLWKEENFEAFINAVMRLVDEVISSLTEGYKVRVR